MSRTLDQGKPAGFPWNKLLLILVVTGFCFVLGAGAGIALLAKFGDFPAIESAAAYRPSVTSKIFDRNNRVVGEIYIERRSVVPFKAIPPHVVNAFVAAEDANFFKHRGVDYFAIVRAVVKDVLSGGFAQGASTITQQTVKFHLTNIYRKLGVKNRTEATRLAYQQGLVESPLPVRLRTFVLVSVISAARSSTVANLPFSATTMVTWAKGFSTLAPRPRQVTPISLLSEITASVPATSPSSAVPSPSWASSRPAR